MAIKMTWPSDVTIMGRKYRIIEGAYQDTDKEEGTVAYGSVWHTRRIIAITDHINSETSVNGALPVEVIIQTFLHEVCHALADITGQEELDKEPMADLFGEAVTQFLRDNPWLVRSMINALQNTNK